MAKGRNRTHYLDEDNLHVYEYPTPNHDFLYDQSTTRNPLYNLGDRIVLGDGRVFRYAKAGHDLPGMKWGVKSYLALVTEKAEIVSAAAVGATSLTVTFDGDFWDTALTLDMLRGGYISLYNSSTVREQRGIIGNTTVAETGGECTIYLDAAIRTAFTSAINCEILANPYSDVRYTTENASVLGMPNVLATTGQYFWLQTWGICRITPTGAELGVNPAESLFVFGTNGAVCSLAAWHTQLATVPTSSYQIAGFLVEWYGSGTGSAGMAAPFINLQINP